MRPARVYLPQGSEDTLPYVTNQYYLSCDKRSLAPVLLLGSHTKLACKELLAFPAPALSFDSLHSERLPSHHERIPARPAGGVGAIPGSHERQHLRQPHEWQPCALQSARSE